MIIQMPDRNSKARVYDNRITHQLKYACGCWDHRNKYGVICNEHTELICAVGSGCVAGTKTKPVLRINL